MTLVLFRGFGMKDKRPNFFFPKTSINLPIKIPQPGKCFLSLLFMYCLTWARTLQLQCLWNALATHKNKNSVGVLQIEAKPENLLYLNFHKQRITLSELPFKSHQMSHTQRAKNDFPTYHDSNPLTDKLSGLLKIKYIKK